MALVASNPFNIGNVAPSFTLLDTASNEMKSLEDLKGTKGTMIMFICNHCPFVLHVNEVLVRLANKYQAKGIQFIAISSNDITTHPQDGPSFMKKAAEELGYSFPYLYDETQVVAKAYDAACTPDFYLFDTDLKATYHGQLDDSRPGNGKEVTGADLSAAMEALLLDSAVIVNQQPSIGCSIKWK